jgi:hypothetical protein
MQQVFFGSQELASADAAAVHLGYALFVAGFCYHSHQDECGSKQGEKNLHAQA